MKRETVIRKIAKAENATPVRRAQLRRMDDWQLGNKYHDLFNEPWLDDDYDPTPAPILDRSFDAVY